MHLFHIFELVALTFVYTVICLAGFGNLPGDMVCPELLFL